MKRKMFISMCMPGMYVGVQFMCVLVPGSGVYICKVMVGEVGSCIKGLDM